MNKIKLMYDVVKTMKEKNVFKGTLKVEGTKDEQRIVSFDNVFEKNNLTGQTKAKINTEVDCEGKKMKMKNSIDCELPGCHSPHGFMKHIHHHHHRGKTGGFKDGLSRVAVLLSILNNIKTEEQEDKSVVLSLELADIPEDVRETIHEKMYNGCKYHETLHGNHDHHLFMKEFHSMKKTDFNLKIFINKNYEIENINLEVKGGQTNNEDEKHDLKFTAVLGLDW